MSVRFDLPPARALAFFRQKGLKTSFAWQDMLREEHTADFTVAKMADLDLLAEVAEIVDRALAEGITLREFIDDLKPELMRRGWWGEAEMTDPDTGETKLVQLGSTRRLRTIFRVNLRTAYAAGHWSRIQEHKAEAPYLLYDAVNDSRTRPAHHAMDGLVLPVDSPYWAIFYPPNGWNCRCACIQIDKRQLKRLGKDGPDEAPPIETRDWTNPRTGEIEQVPKGVDPGWDYNPGAARGAHLQQVMQAKAAAAGDELGPAALAAVAEGTPPTLDAAIETGRAKVAELMPGEEFDGATFRARLLDEVDARVGRMRRVRLVSNRGKGVDLVRAISRYFPDTWIAAADRLGPLHARSVRSRAWQFTTLIAQRMRLPSFGVVDGAAGAGYLAVSNEANAVHEFTHRLQAAVPGLDDYFQQLHERRTAGEPQQRLRDLTGVAAYRASEVARKDDYIEPYFGKEYPEHVGSYHGRTGALEVMTMAYDHVFGRQPQLLERLAAEDPELLHLAIGLLFDYAP